MRATKDRLGRGACHENDRRMRTLVVLLSAALFGCTGTDGIDGSDGADGEDGTSCTVADNGDGTHTITCEDGTTTTVEDGLDGTDGQDGADGQNGNDGQDGTSCTVIDNGDGTSTISCTDGSSVSVAQGEDGISCWDTDGDGVADSSEDVTGDGSWNADDCQGASTTYAVIPAEYADMNLMALHDPSSAAYLSTQHGECIACHGDKTDESTSDAAIPTAHQAMFKVSPYSSLSGNERCESCHTYDSESNRIAVDLWRASGAGSGALIRKQVDVRSCARCHGPTSSHPFYTSTK